MTENTKEFYSATPYQTKCSKEYEIQKLVELAAINYKQIRDLTTSVTIILLCLLVYFSGTILGSL